MSAFEYLNILINETLFDKSLKQVSPIMYDAELLDKKVSVLIFKEDENGHLVGKMKIIVKDITKDELLPIFDVIHETLPMNHKFTS